MFYNEQRPEDEQIDVVNILNRNRNIYKQLFEYFYTGETFVAIVDALDLMEEFHTHDIPTQSLEDYVRDYLNIDMFADAFATAVALNLNLLKDNTGLFIDNANAREIFAKFNYLRLPEMTIKELFVDYCRELAFDGIMKWAIYQVTQIIPKNTELPSIEYFSPVQCSKMREYLTPLLHLVDFRTLSDAQLNQVKMFIDKKVIPSNILDDIIPVKTTESLHTAIKRRKVE